MNLPKIVVFSILLYETLFLSPQRADFKNEKSANFLFIRMLSGSFSALCRRMD